MNLLCKTASLTHLVFRYCKIINNASHCQGKPSAKEDDAVGLASLGLNSNVAEFVQFPTIFFFTKWVYKLETKQNKTKKKREEERPPAPAVFSW